jgi:hypothetical protein
MKNQCMLWQSMQLPLSPTWRLASSLEKKVCAAAVAVAFVTLLVITECVIRPY